jgi:hypothetical protein
MNGRRVGAIGRKSQVSPSAVLLQRNRFLLETARSARLSRKRPPACWGDSASPRTPAICRGRAGDMARRPIVKKRSYEGLVAKGWTVEEDRWRRMLR